jgi:hypothetical protein
MTKLVEKAMDAISKLPPETQDDPRASCWRSRPAHPSP